MSFPDISSGDNLMKIFGRRSLFCAITMPSTTKNKVCLMFVSILSISSCFINRWFLDSVHDGWGLAPEEGTEGNAIEAGNTTYMDKITNEHAATTLLASGTAVGLSEGLMGNSEVG